ncbi:hypothetical protein EWW47_28510 (plasmid) [Bacillus thuringiensis]|uniref:Uncharacterized protein n=1 Tax=Bacillus thuringiensis TaxID=1428 RepID=A0AB35PNS2_BACTU|nr:hypothetical protein FYW98_31880 [Bacillus thuringiensis]OTX72410.1 hypothetical protein BK719_12185 [Bacillus thuringiensis serovar novosibirsk]MDE4529326.1 hypothetical protein [Bacillus thuringiensis]MDR4180960.1 hypothetical protein [Bacillus thuringiensis]MDV6360223.1 hypothetical protein [Bacillus thuringiensis]
MRCVIVTPNYQGNPLNRYYVFAKFCKTCLGNREGCKCLRCSFYIGVTIHAHQLNILKYPPNEKIALLRVNIELEYRLSRINN